MKAGEQLSAMEVMAVDPMRRVLVPRLWGGIIAMPILAAVFSMVGILGGWVVGVLMIGVDPGAFWSQMQNSVDVWNDVLNGVIKSLVFGVTVTLVSLYEGWQAKPTPEGVARATTHRGGGIAGGAGPGFPAYGLDVWKLIRIDHVTRKTDFWVGLFVLLGAAALAFLALRAGNLSAFSFAPTYTVTANFDNVGGLKVRAPPSERRRGGGADRRHLLRRQDLPGGGVHQP